jgi:hypothetical protein
MCSIGYQSLLCVLIRSIVCVHTLYTYRAISDNILALHFATKVSPFENVQNCKPVTRVTFSNGWIRAVPVHNRQHLYSPLWVAGVVSTSGMNDSSAL